MFSSTSPNTLSRAYVIRILFVVGVLFPRVWHEINTVFFFFSSFSPHCLRVLEASIAENKACLKRTPTEIWRDSRNPYDRKRQDKAPVGLKNVGNTCWFSAVIQVRIFTKILLGGHDSSGRWVVVVFLLNCVL